MTNAPLGSRENPRQFRDLLPREKLTDGAVYLGWPCHRCGVTMAIDESSDDAVRLPDAHYVEVTCPHCGQSDTRTWGGRERLEYSPKAPISIVCQTCGTTHSSGGYTAAALRRLLADGGTIEGYCIKFDKLLTASPHERASIANALGLSSWK